MFKVPKILVARERFCEKVAEMVKKFVKELAGEALSYI